MQKNTTAMTTDDHEVRTLASGHVVAVECATGKATLVVDTWPCSWLVERAPDREVDFPSDLVGECGAPAVTFADGFACAGGHSHTSQGVYLDDDEIVVGNPATLAPGARRMDGQPLT